MTSAATLAEASLQKKCAVFLDRDGTLIEDCGYLREPREVIFFEETVEALRRLQAHARLFIVTNQSGVGKGLITAAEAERVNAFVMDYLQKQGVVITELYCCPHRRDDGCACIKPKPHFLQEAARKYDVDLKQSFVIGDHPYDIAFACNAGATGIYVLSGHGLKHRNEMEPGGIIVPGIREAVDWVLATQALREQEMRHPGLLREAASFARQDGNNRKVTKPHTTGEDQMQKETVPLVSIVMGSKSDLDTLKEASMVLDAFGLAHELRVISAHRTPEAARTYALSAETCGIRVIIAAAGKAAHLAGVVASMTTLPIIGVPMTTSDLGGLDSLLSMVQMPGGIPVATVAIGKAGAKNAALLAIAILALSDSSLRDRLVKYRTDMTEEVEQADQMLQAERKTHGGA